MQAESVFPRTGTNVRKPWSRAGDPVAVCRRSRRNPIVVFGTLAEN